MSYNQPGQWLPTPAFLYRNYLYRKIVKAFHKKDHFLDVGTGNGKFLKWLLKAGFKGESIDISPKAVEFAKKEFEGDDGLTVKMADIFRYESKDKYDVIFCFEVLEHIRDDKLAMKKIFSLLNPGGIFVMSVPAHMSMWSKIDEVKGHYRRYKRVELVYKLSQANFKIKNILTYGFPVLNLLRMVSGSGQFVKSNTQHQGKNARGQESSIQQEYNPKLKFILGNQLLLFPLFKLMDLFTGTDLGVGYIVIAKKPKA